MSIAILGNGAFGTALAVSLSAKGPVTLWGRSAEDCRSMQATRENKRHLAGVTLPQNITISAELETVLQAETLLLAIPMQQLSGFLAAHNTLLNGKTLVACSKGIDLATLRGQSATIENHCPEATPALLTGPSFATDIAHGLPTALTLACRDQETAIALQNALSTPALRLYTSDDVTGAELGGALKNVVAIAAGVVVGAGLGDSARAALMTRGFAEMQRLAVQRGARAETLMGLSGFGDLVLTCTSEQSRNYRFGLALGRGESFDSSITVEGAATAKAVSILAKNINLELPIATMVAALVERKITVETAVNMLMTRPLKQE